MKSDKLNKLIRHEKSAREIGSVHEADIFLEKINELRKQAEKTLTAISCDIICSCGFKMDLTIEAGKHTQKIFDAFVNPHLEQKHNLEIFQK